MSFRRSFSQSKPDENMARQTNQSRVNAYDMITPSRDHQYDDMMADAMELQSPPVDFLAANNDLLGVQQ